MSITDWADDHMTLPPPTYQFRMQGYTGLRMKLMLIEMMDFGFADDRFYPDDLPTDILYVLITQANLKVGKEVRDEVVQIISAYLMGLRAMPDIIPLN